MKRGAALRRIAPHIRTGGARAVQETKETNKKKKNQKLETFCGNGIVEAPEECDGTLACTGGCVLQVCNVYYCILLICNTHCM